MKQYYRIMILITHIVVDIFVNLNSFKWCYTIITKIKTSNNQSMGNCVTTNNALLDKNKIVLRQINTPTSSSLFSQGTIVLDEHEWSLIKNAYDKCREGDEYLESGNLEAALHRYKLMLHIPPRLTNNEVAALYIRQIGRFLFLL